MQLADVQRVTAAYLTPSNRTNGLYIPTEKPVRAPAAESTDLAALFKDYKGKDTAQAVAAFDTSPANINAPTQRTPLALPNGKDQLALLSKPPRGDRVDANLLLQFGGADSLKNHP